MAEAGPVHSGLTREGEPLTAAEGEPLPDSTAKEPEPPATTADEALPDHPSMEDGSRPASPAPAPPAAPNAPPPVTTAKRPEPAYLITKPFLAETVKATIGQALFFHGVKR